MIHNTAAPISWPHDTIDLTAPWYEESTAGTSWPYHTHTCITTPSHPYHDPITCISWPDHTNVTIQWHPYCDSIAPMCFYHTNITTPSRLNRMHIMTPYYIVSLSHQYHNPITPKSWPQRTYRDAPGWSQPNKPHPCHKTTTQRKNQTSRWVQCHFTCWSLQQTSRP